MDSSGVYHTYLRYVHLWGSFFVLLKKYLAGLGRYEVVYVPVAIQWQIDRYQGDGSFTSKNAGHAIAMGISLDGDGGGTWIVSLKDTPSITDGDGDAECTIKMAANDYVDMMEGRAQGQDLFFAGKLQIDGDMGLAMKLQALTEIMA